MDPSAVNWLAVAVGAVLTFVVGGVWYSPLLFGRTWQRLVGLSDAELRKGVARTYAASFVCAWVAAANLAFFLGKDATVTFGVAAGAAAGVGWVATAMITTSLFERRPPALIAIDVGYHALSYAMMGALLGAWR